MSTQLIESPYSEFAIITISVCSLALVFNMALLMPNIRHLRKLPASSFLTICMTIADSTAATSCLYSSVMYLLTGGIEDNSTACRVFGAMATWSHGQTITMVTLLSYFRYFVVVKKIRLSVNIAAIGVVYMAVTLAITAAVPFFTHDEADAYSLNGSRVLCVYRWFGRNPLTRAIAWTCIVGTLIPILSLGYIYLSIYKSVVYINSSVRESLEPMEKYGRLKSSSTNNSKMNTECSAVPTSDERHERTLLKQCVSIVVSFSISWCPYVTLMLVEVILGSELPVVFVFFSQILVCFNSVVNPLIILAFDGSIRENCLRSLCLSHSNQ